MAEDGLGSSGRLVSDAARREAERTAAKAARQAETLRANLKRRKDQARDRTGAPTGRDPQLPHGSKTDLV